ncbi:hypothetical protein BUZ27_02360 [Staphylococcus haemolyticus]|nr:MULTISPECIES: hypothetical protein [Staphylococcus]MCE5049412.1 hypothetical protein [Staphylococcus haemolyticus]MWF63418.1 hypothetical protein [Staphylococcus haemolyticus]PTK49728.1 hypothetical protein BUZ43_03225 [Staphylococcus haemolyticus]PTK59646.1 hypothetical protein BUZ36_10695 [Staphylococcus haemolyticus]PTK78265.1 hypothetical protein BUZ27_02360 [Staphylococcus haemolyticus]
MKKILLLVFTIICISLIVSGCSQNIINTITKPKISEEEKFKKKLVGKYFTVYGSYLEFRSNGELKREVLGRKELLKYQVTKYDGKFAEVDFIDVNNNIDTFYFSFDSNGLLEKRYDKEIQGDIYYRE